MALKGPFFESVCPTLGAVLATIMFLAPLKQVRVISRVARGRPGMTCTCTPCCRSWRRAGQRTVRDSTWSSTPASSPTAWVCVWGGRLQHAPTGSTPTRSPPPPPGWLAYSFTLKNLYVFFANLPGFLLGIFYFLSAFAIRKDQRPLAEKMLLGFASVQAVLGVISTVALSSKEARQYLWGISTNLILLMYYASPLSTMKEASTMMKG